jgi:hypothetical protein
MIDADLIEQLGRKYGHVRVMTLAAFLRRTELVLSAEDVALMASPAIAPPVTPQMVTEVAQAVGFTLGARQGMQTRRDIF